MDVSPAALVNASTQMAQDQLAQSVHVSVLKKAMNIQAAGVQTLLSSLPGALPLASSGTLGTRVNEMA